LGWNTGYTTTSARITSQEQAISMVTITSDMLPRQGCTIPILYLMVQGISLRSEANAPRRNFRRLVLFEQVPSGKTRRGGMSPFSSTIYCRSVTMLRTLASCSGLPALGTKTHPSLFVITPYKGRLSINSPATKDRLAPKAIISKGMSI